MIDEVPSSADDGGKVKQNAQGYLEHTLDPDNECSRLTTLITMKTLYIKCPDRNIGKIMFALRGISESISDNKHTSTKTNEMMKIAQFGQR